MKAILISIMQNECNEICTKELQLELWNKIKKVIIRDEKKGEK